MKTRHGLQRLTARLAPALLLAALPAGAETDASETDAPELPTVESEIVVTSTMPEMATERRLQDDEITEPGVTDLAELFRGVEGLSAVRRGPVNLER